MITGDFVNGLHLMVGLSTDNKPAQTSENTFLLEEDTGKAYYFSNGEWAEAGEGATLIINALLGGGRDLPAVDESDDGKVLGVEDGAWKLVEGGADPEAIAQAVTDWLDENITEPTEPIVDASLSVSGAAADAQVTGKIFTDEAKSSLLSLLQDVAYATPNGAEKLADLEDKLFTGRYLTSITADYEQDRPIYDTDSLDPIRYDLTVTANYSDGTSEVLADEDYTLSGTLTVGTSTITVSYEGKTATITVIVTAAAQPIEGVYFNNIGIVTHTDKYLTSNSSIGCIMYAFNCEQNTNYKIKDSGTHKLFRFYGHLALMDLTKTYAQLVEEYPSSYSNAIKLTGGIIADASTDADIDAKDEVTINSGDSKTIWVYLTNTSGYSPNVTVTEVT